jgi:hypothetical protein
MNQSATTFETVRPHSFTWGGTWSFSCKILYLDKFFLSMTTPKTNPSEHYKHFRKAIAFPFWKFLFYFILTALLNDVQTARVRTGLKTHARHSPS